MLLRYRRLLSPAPRYKPEHSQAGEHQGVGFRFRSWRYIQLGITRPVEQCVAELEIIETEGRKSRGGSGDDQAADAAYAEYQ